MVVCKHGKRQCFTHFQEIYYLEQRDVGTVRLPGRLREIDRRDIIQDGVDDGFLLHENGSGQRVHRGRAPSISRVAGLVCHGVLTSVSPHMLQQNTVDLDSIRSSSLGNAQL
jgi:hypothetical protein